MSKKSQPSTGLIVRNPDSLSKECERVIRRALNKKNIGFDELKSNIRNRKIYELRGTTTSRAKAKHSYSVIPIHQAPAGFYWFAATIEFVFLKGNYSVEQVSLLIFQGVATDENKTPLLRAEWDSIDLNSRSNHAQPHWHIYASPLNEKLVSERTEFKPEIEISDFQQGQENSHDGIWEEGVKFHFAMASKWHLDGVGSHQETLEREKLLNWLEGCIIYIREQLIYIVK